CARTPSPRNRGWTMLRAGGVCLDSACDWWHRLQGVFPACDSEPGSVFGVIIGDPDPVTPCRKRVVPVCNTDLSLLTAASPAPRLGAGPLTGRCARLPATAGRQQPSQSARLAARQQRACAPRRSGEKDHLYRSIRLSSLPPKTTGNSGLRSSKSDTTSACAS